MCTHTLQVSASGIDSLLSAQTDPRRGEFIEKVEALLDRLKQLVPVDEAADEVCGCVCLMVGVSTV